MLAYAALLVCVPVAALAIGYTLLSVLESHCYVDTVAYNIYGGTNQRPMSLWQRALFRSGRSASILPYWCGHCGVSTRGNWLWGYRFDCMRGTRNKNVVVLTRHGYHHVRHQEPCDCEPTPDGPWRVWDQKKPERDTITLPDGRTTYR